MGVQSSSYVIDGATRTFPSTKHIASKQHCSVRVKRIIDNIWEAVEPSEYSLINNSIIFVNAPLSYLYDSIEIRVADTQDELAGDPTDLSLIASSIDDISVVADNIASIIAASNGIYLTNGLPSIGSVGDLAVNTVDGGIYQYNGTSWDLVAQSSGSTSGGTVPLGVNIVTGLPAVAANGEIVFNQADGYFYGYINGTWKQMISTPTVASQVGVEVVVTDPTTGNYEGRVIFNTTDNKLKKFVAGVYIQVVEPTTAAATVADGSLTTAKFASTIRPVEIFDVLPTVGNAVGRLVYLTSDGLLYRYAATGFSTAVPAGTITGTITGVQIGTDTITAANIATNAITTNEIAANAITSDKITSNSITTGMIQAGAIGATQIATNAITADKLNAGSVTAGKIAALSIDATKIIAGSIGADQLAANSITAGKIAAGSVSANHIASGTITATQIASGTITAGQLAAYAITADKLDANALTGHHANFDASKGTVNASIFAYGYTAVVVANGGTNTSFGVAAIGSTHGLAAEARAPGGASASVLGWGETQDTVGVLGTAKTHHGVGGTSLNGVGVYGITQRADKQWGLITHQRTYSGSGYFPFTGSHITFGTGEYFIGDIVDTVDGKLIDVDQSYMEVSTAYSAKSKKVLGVVTTVDSDVEKNLRNNSTLCNRVVTGTGKMAVITYPTYKAKYKPYIDNLVAKEYKEIGVNSLGEGGINVCSEGGNIEIGDYICSSNTKGKGMKQDDDLLHNYTVAKALEAVDWSKETQTTKMIACTYHCG